MLPSAFWMLTSVLIALVIAILSPLIKKVFEVVILTGVVISLFIAFPFSEAIILFAVASSTYAYFGELFTKEKRNFRQILKRELQEKTSEPVNQYRDNKRLIADLVLTFVVVAGGVAFLLFAPASFSLVKMFIIFYMIPIFQAMLVRIDNYFATIFWLPEEKHLIIYSYVESRRFPMEDLEQLTLETSPDVLRLHPLFTFLSKTQDYTSSFEKVLRLDFPGETIYLTPKERERWKEIFFQQVANSESPSYKKNLPFWHPRHLKRLLWKGYFAITVRGISAYTGLLLVLIFLKVPSYVMILVVGGWWIFNLYISDRVLIASTDAKEVKEEDILSRLGVLSKRAKIRQPRLFLVDSPVYNGLATGMNIGRGTIILTTATLQLPKESVDAILAHELMHVKKRDVLLNQIARMLFFIVLGVCLYIFYDEIVQLAEHVIIFVLGFYLVLYFFLFYSSFMGQYAEMRADYLASQLLDGQRLQMAQGLEQLGKAQDKSDDKTFQYQTLEDDQPVTPPSSIDRGQWFLRFIEFQFLMHPPLYFRLHCLRQNYDWKETVVHLLKARFSESLPDLFGRKSKYEP